MAIGKKIASTCAALLILTLILGGLNWYMLQAIHAAVSSITVDSLPGTREIGLIDAYAQALRAGTWRHLASLSAAQIDAADRAVEKSGRDFREATLRYDKTITQAPDRVLFDKMVPLYQQFMKGWQRSRELSRLGRKAQAMAFYEAEIRPVSEELDKAIADLVEFNRTFGVSQSRTALQSADSAILWTWVLLLLSVITGSLLAAWVVRDLNRQLGVTAASLQEAAVQLSGAAAQVAGSSQSMAQGASEQAASLEETSAASEEINSMAGRNSENSVAATQLLSESQEQFRRTNQSLDLLIAAMADINSQSGRISKIIKVIDEIAFQTNILALNAAVEAARAGEAGMGFAVVADEVRNLAQRCAQAAKDTTGLIEESISKSADGKGKVDEVAAAIRSITADSGKVKSLVDEVSAGSQEQARGVSQIGTALIQMRQVTQGSAASAEEGAAAAEQLSAQAESLKELVRELRTIIKGRDAADADAVPTAVDSTMRTAKDAGETGAAGPGRFRVF